MNLKKILVVKEFPDVFPEELPRILPEREVDMSIEVVHTPISKASYRMAPTKLRVEDSTT